MIDYAGFILNVIFDFIKSELRWLLYTLNNQSDIKYIKINN